MNPRSYQIKELAELARVTVRTLHHYDSIGLLAPSDRTGAGYRLYSDQDLLRLQQILIYRELGMPLEQIRRILDDPGFDRREALLEQREALRKRARDTTNMIRSVETALAAIDGETEMDPQKIFDGFDPKEHEQEAEARWGGTDAFKESRRRTKSYRPEDWARMKAEERALMEALAEKLSQGLEPGEEGVLELAERHRLHIDRWFYPCSHAMHTQLAGLYATDPRFAVSFDKHGEGLAEFLSSAIRANAARG
jgi:DNA-binding transcriptional MerR regulator